MLRYIDLNTGVIQLTQRDSECIEHFPNHKVTVCPGDNEVIIRAYEEGDETNIKFSVKKIYSRNRIVIPRRLRIQYEMMRAANVTRREDGAFILRPDARDRS